MSADFDIHRPRKPQDVWLFFAIGMLAEYMGGFYEAGQRWRADDRAVIAAVGRLGFNPTWSLMPLDGRVVAVAVAGHGGSPVGVAVLRDRPSWGPALEGSLEVTKVFVRPGARGMGVGHALVSAIVGVAGEDPLGRPLRLASGGPSSTFGSEDVQASRSVSRRLYESHGFTVDGPGSHAFPDGLDRMTWSPGNQFHANLLTDAIR